MKSLIIALNSKYIHSALGVWYLKASCGEACGEVKVLEFTINEQLDVILSEIYKERAQVAAFSCYIWNIDQVLKLTRNLKKVSPEITIVLGGPEVSHNAEEITRANSQIDYILAGEGEQTFRQLLQCLHNGTCSREEIEGLCYRQGYGIAFNKGYPLIQELDSIPSPYTGEMLGSLGNKLVYYESSRGCPFSCSYCISSTFEGVRYFSMQRVKDDLTRLIKSGDRMIKFVDRTFNCNKNRAKEIFRFIIDNPGECSFHFEVAGDLFDDEILDILADAPPGLIQFEIGLQSTNPETLEAISRKTSLDKLFNNVKRLRKFHNIHLHLDLIAGLPYEDYNSFKRSFNEVYALKPHNLQLGFLKMLHGSKVRKEAELHQYSFRGDPPYEVLFNKYIHYEEMLKLKGIEELLERYYNSGRFVESLQYITRELYQTPFDFYYEFMEFNTVKDYLNHSKPSKALYTILLEFFNEVPGVSETEVLVDLMKFDFLRSDASRSLPHGLNTAKISGFKELCFEFLKNEEKVSKYIPEHTGNPAKQIYKQVHFEVFDYNILSNYNKDFSPRMTVVAFDYTTLDKVTGLYSFKKIEPGDFFD